MTNNDLLRLRRLLSKSQADTNTLSEYAERALINGMAHQANVALTDIIEACTITLERRRIELSAGRTPKSSQPKPLIECRTATALNRLEPFATGAKAKPQRTWEERERDLYRKRTRSTKAFYRWLYFSEKG